MRINKTILAISIVAILFGSVFVSTSLGLWSTQSSKVPIKYNEGNFTGEYNPIDIRGSYSFGEISNLFGIPLDVLGSAFAISNNDSKDSFLCKYLEEIYAESAEQGKEVGTDSVRIFVALYKGLPIILNEGTYFPETAEAILLDEGNLTEEQKIYVKSHLVTAKTEHVENANSDETSEDVVRGKTTFNDVIALGISHEDIERVIGGKIPSLTQTIRDYCVANDLQFSSIKTQIQALIK